MGFMAQGRCGLSNLDLAGKPSPGHVPGRHLSLSGRCLSCRSSRARLRLTLCSTMATLEGSSGPQSAECGSPEVRPAVKPTAWPIAKRSFQELGEFCFHLFFRYSPPWHAAGAPRLCDARAKLPSRGPGFPEYGVAPNNPPLTCAAIPSDP